MGYVGDWRCLPKPLIRSLILFPVLSFIHCLVLPLPGFLFSKENLCQNKYLVDVWILPSRQFDILVWAMFWVSDLDRGCCLSKEWPYLDTVFIKRMFIVKCNSECDVCVLHSVLMQPPAVPICLLFYFCIHEIVQMVNNISKHTLSPICIAK